MHNLIRFYYRNRYKIWGIIIAIILLIVIIQILNGMLAKQNKREIDSIMKNNVSQNTTISTNKNEIYFSTDESKITKDKVNETDLKKAKTIIEDFVGKCNDKDIEGAYNLLSEDCKKEYYQNIEKFQNYYYNSNFGNSRKLVTIENWILDTYRIRIRDDMMSTGKVSELSTEDYYTVVKENDEYKLNINSFISKKEINKNQTVDNIKFNVLSVRTFMDYEIYTIKVENGTENNIILDTKKDSKSIYFEDTKENKYYVYTNELSDALLKVNKGFSTQIEIKVFNGYKSSLPQMRYMVFTDVEIKSNNNGEKQKKLITINL